MVLTSNHARVAQTFQKLIFVSNLVFGDQQAAFLLPWERTFKLTKAQLQVAKRDSGKALFKSFLDQRGGQLEVSCCVLTPTPLGGVTHPETHGLSMHGCSVTTGAALSRLLRAFIGPGGSISAVVRCRGWRVGRGGGGRGRGRGSPFCRASQAAVGAGGQADRAQLTELRTYQESVRLGADVATEIVKEALRARVEGFLDAAVECTKRRTRQRDYSDVVLNVGPLDGCRPAGWPLQLAPLAPCCA